MKTKIFTALLASMSTLGVSTQAFAQNKSDLSRSIDDDGRSLFIRVNGCVNGRILNFERKVDVRGWSAEEKLAMTDTILDSLGVGRISLSADDDRPSRKKSGRRWEYSHASERNITVDNNTVTVSSREEPQAAPFSDIKPSNREIWTDENGFLYIRFKVLRGKDEFIFEKSTEAKGMTESGKQKFIRDFEKELELPVM